MALALVPRARGRGEKTANFWQKSSTFDPISEGTRRKKRAAGPPAGEICHCRSCCWSEIRSPVNLSGKKPGGLLNRIHQTSSIEPAAGVCLNCFVCLLVCFLLTNIEHRASSIEHRASSIEHRTTGRGPRSLRLGHRPSGKGPLV